MRFQTWRPYLIVVAGMALFYGVPSRAARVPRIELLRAVEVAGARLALSDLLPENAADSLRARATEISLGAAPQLGVTRTLDALVLIGEMRNSRDMLSEISVPDHIVVSREARAITVVEVFDAVRKALERSGVRTAGTLQPSDILLQTQIFVSPGDAGLQVMRIDVDAGMGRARFLLWASRDPAVLPFFVAVRFDEDLPMIPIHGAGSGYSTSHPGRAVAAKPAQEEILVSPGTRATLVLQSATLRMLADVDPLQRGSLGQQIRVRIPDTGKIFTAQVDGRAHLAVKF